MATRRAGRSDDFFRLIPGRAVAVFLAGVFCVFAPMGLLTVSDLEPARPASHVVLLMLVSGCIAVSWAATFTVSRWFAIGIVVFTATMVLLPNGSRFGLDLARPQFSLTSFVVIASIVAGYVLFVVFISGRGRSTLRMMTELSLARDIHDTLVPTLAMSRERLELLGASTPSTEMGGDLVDVVEHDGVTDVFLADVSGHGVRAGVVMGMVKSALRMALGSGSSLAELPAQLNDVLEATTSAELYATFAAVRIAPDGEAEYVLAGHHHITHVTAGGEVRRLGERSFPLGLFAGRTYEPRSTTLGPGDLLAIYTDGLNETADEADEELGHEPIERVLAARRDAPLEEIRDAVLAVVETHGRHDDDRTLLLVRMR